MQGWELRVRWYHVIYGLVAYDMYVMYVSYASLICMLCYSFPANSHIYTPPASRSKLICIGSVGSTVISGTQSLLTGTQLQPLCSRLSVLSLTSLPDRCSCCGLRWPPLGDSCYLISVNYKHYSSCAPPLVAVFNNRRRPRLRRLRISKSTIPVTILFTGAV